MQRSSKHLTLFLTSFVALTLVLLAASPMASLAQTSATAAATMAATMAATSAAGGSLPAACGTASGTIRDLALQIKADPAKKVKIGFLFVGPVDDFGYNYAANQGRLCLEAVYPGSTVFAENVPETAEAERVMENMIKNNGATIIFPTSYGHYDPATHVSKKYPNVFFFHMGGPKAINPNLGTFFGDIWQMVYVSGYTAGKMSKSGKLGYIVAFPIAQTLLNVNAFELGAKAANPSATTTVVFTGNWCDPAKLSAAANNLVDQGIDVLTMHQDCPKPVIEVADRRGVYVVGYHADGSSVSPKAWLTGSMWVWGPTMLMLVDQTLNAKYTPSVLFYGPKEGIVDLAPFGTSVPKDVQDSTLKLKADVIAGTVFPFTGPIKNQKSDIVVKDGEKPNETTLQAMDYLVEGVIGTLPQ